MRKYVEYDFYNRISVFQRITSEASKYAEILKVCYGQILVFYLCIDICGMVKWIKWSDLLQLHVYIVHNNFKK